MTLIILLMTLYTVLGIGYFKMVHSTVEDLIGSEVLIIAIICVVWPLPLGYTLLREAVK